MIASDKFPTHGFAPRDRGCYFELPAWAIGAMVVASTAVTAIGAITQGNAAAGAAGANAEAMRRAADLEQQQGLLAADRQRRQGQIDRGKSLAVLAASGIDPTQGSPLDLLSEQAKENEFQAEQIKFQHDQNAWRLRMGGVAQDVSGAAALARGTGTAIGTLASGAVKGLALMSTAAGGAGEEEEGPFGGPTAPRPD